MTRKRGNKWYQKLLAGVMGLSLMVLCMLPTSAAECRHNYDHTAIKKIVGYNAGEHTFAICDYKVCRICGHTDTEELSRGTESHTIEYTDLGESNGIHHYKVRCTVCSFSQTM